MTTELQIPTPEQLKAARESNGLTQRELAEMLGVSLSKVVKMESGSLPADRRTTLALMQLKVLD